MPISVIETHVRARTTDFDKKLKGVARTLSSLTKGMASGISAINAAASAAEKSFSGIATSLLTAFAAGGPVGLALATVGTGIGLIIGKNKELVEEQEKAHKATVDRMDAESKAAKAIITDLEEQITKTKRLIELRADMGVDPSDAQMRREMAQRKLDEIGARRADFERAFGIPAGTSSLAAEDEETQTRLRAEVALLDKLIALEHARAGVGVVMDKNARFAEAAAQAAERERDAREDIAGIPEPWQDPLEGMRRGMGGGRPVGFSQSGATGGGVSVADELDALGESMDRVGSIGEDAFTTIGNAIDFAAIRAGDFASILQNVASQMANLVLNRALGGLSASIFGGQSTGGAFGPEDPIPGGASLASAPMVMNVYTQDASSFNRSERQVKAAAQRMLR